MEIFGYILLVALVALILYGAVVYNRLVAAKHNVQKAWGNIDVLLKQRHDELPKLVETCRQYMQYEQATLNQVITARSRVATARETGNLAALGAAEGALRAGLGQLFALVENYPELKANESFQHLQARITGLENAVADRRELYNETVNVNNVLIEQVPDVFVARLFQFGPAQLLRFSAEQTVDVDMRSLFAG